MEAPKLRFKEFNSPWEEVEVGKIGEFFGGGTPDTNVEEFWAGDIPWISSSDIFDNDINSVNITRYISHDAVKKSATKIIPKNSLLIVSRVGVGKFAVAPSDVTTSQDFTNLVLNQKLFNNSFFAYNLYQNKNLLHKIAQGTSIKGFTTVDLKKIKLKKTSLSEQQKIADFLQTADERIALLKQKKELMERYKKGVMQKIFSQVLRFKDKEGKEFPQWASTTLGKITNIIGGGTPDTNKPEYWNGSVQWFTPTEIKTNYVSTSTRTITSLGLKSSSARLLPKGTILLTSRATIGEVAIATQECTTNQGFQSLIIGNEVNIYFLFNWLKNNKNELLKRANGSTFAEISKKEIEQIPIQAPIKKEQDLIGNFLHMVDIKIDTVENQLKLAELWKKGLLQQMFV